MILILISIVSITVLAIWASNKNNSMVVNLISYIFVYAGFLGLIVYSFLCYDYFGAEYKKQIINREYGTNYSQLDVFYASDVIDKIQEINRKRIELNDDIITCN